MGLRSPVSVIIFHNKQHCPRQARRNLASSSHFGYFCIFGACYVIVNQNVNLLNNVNLTDCLMPT